MHDDASDPPAVLEAGARPRLARIGRTEHPPPGGDVAARERLTRPGVHDVRIARRHRERADGRYGLHVEYRRPVNAAVARLPETARRCPGVVRVGVARDARNGGDAVPLGADVAGPESLIDGGIDLVRRDFLELLPRLVLCRRDGRT